MLGPALGPRVPGERGMLWSSAQVSWLGRGGRREAVAAVDQAEQRSGGNPPGGNCPSTCSSYHKPPSAQHLSHHHDNAPHAEQHWGRWESQEIGPLPSRWSHYPGGPSWGDIIFPAVLPPTPPSAYPSMGSCDAQSFSQDLGNKMAFPESGIGTPGSHHCSTLNSI